MNHINDIIKCVNFINKNARIHEMHYNDDLNILLNILKYRNESKEIEKKIFSIIANIKKNFIKIVDNMKKKSISIIDRRNIRNHALTIKWINHFLNRNKSLIPAEWKHMFNDAEIVDLDNFIKLLLLKENKEQLDSKHFGIIDLKMLLNIWGDDTLTVFDYNIFLRRFGNNWINVLDTLYGEYSFNPWQNWERMERINKERQREVLNNTNKEQLGENSVISIRFSRRFPVYFAIWYKDNQYLNKLYGKHVPILEFLQYLKENRQINNDSKFKKQKTPEHDIAFNLHLWEKNRCRYENCNNIAKIMSITCGHKYFCEKHFNEYYNKDKKCPECGMIIIEYKKIRSLGN